MTKTKIYTIIIMFAFITSLLILIGTNIFSETPDKQEANIYYSKEQCLDIETYIKNKGKLAGVIKESMEGKENEA